MDYVASVSAAPFVNCLLTVFSALCVTLYILYKRNNAE